MLGIVFTEFFDHVENRYGFDMLEDMIEDSGLPHGGAYTSVGTYPHSEIVDLVTSLSSLSGTPVPQLVEEFGQNLGERFSRKFEHFFSGQPGFFDFLESVEDNIHAEVKKLYPDARPPRIEAMGRDANSLCLRYRSMRGMDDLAVGLVRASARHYGETIDVDRVRGVDEDGSYVDIFVRRSAGGATDA